MQNKPERMFCDLFACIARRRLPEYVKEQAINKYVFKNLSLNLKKICIYYLYTEVEKNGSCQERLKE